MPEIMTVEDWLECLPFTGPEAMMPAGVIISTPGIDILDLVVDVRRIPMGAVYDVVLNEKIIKEISGEDGTGILIVDAVGEGNMTRQEFYDSHGQRDGLKGWAVRRLYMQEHGEGVH